MKYLKKSGLLNLKRKNSWGSQARLRRRIGDPVGASPRGFESHLQRMEIYTDGASRGNPGNAAIAYVIVERGKILESGSEFIGVATNNEAEYKAIIKALKEAKKYKPKKVKCYSDSNLVINQLKGLWKVKAPQLSDFYNEVKNLEKEFKIEYCHVPRSNKWITICDSMANHELNVFTNK